MQSISIQSVEVVDIAEGLMFLKLSNYRNEHFALKKIVEDSHSIHTTTTRYQNVSIQHLSLSAAQSLVYLFFDLFRFLSFPKPSIHPSVPLSPPRQLSYGLRGHRSDTRLPMVGHCWTQRKLTVH